MRDLTTIIVAVTLCGCGASATVPADAGNEAMTTCGDVGECHVALWPRVIVGLIPIASDQSRLEEVLKVRFRELPTGALREGRKRPCPRETPSIVCSVGDYPSAAARQVEIVIDAPDGTSTTSEVELIDFNYCARKIAYVPVLVDRTLRLEQQEVRYVSPCDGPSRS